MFFNSDPSSQQFVIKNIKTMLNKTYIMCLIVTDGEMNLLNPLTTIFITIRTIYIKLCMPIQNMHKYRYLF